MTRSKVLVSGCVLAATLGMPTTAAAQPCEQADECSQGQCQQRLAVIRPTCDSQHRSCAALPPTQKDELRQRVAANQSCMRAREQHAKCFSQPDAGLRAEIDKAKRNMDECAARLAR